MLGVSIFILSLALFSIIAVNDLLFFRIEDSVVVSSIILYCIFCISGITSWSLYALSIGSIFFISSAILNRLNMLGGGDVKLLFGIGLLVSDHMLEFFLAMSLVSVIAVSIYILFWRTIEKYRVYYAIKIFRRKDSILKCIFFPSACKIEKNELFSDIEKHKNSACTFKQEIPYGVILSISTLISISDMLYK